MCIEPLERYNSIELSLFIISIFILILNVKFFVYYLTVSKALRMRFIDIKRLLNEKYDVLHRITFIFSKKDALIFLIFMR